MDKKEIKVYVMTKFDSREHGSGCRQCDIYNSLGEAQEAMKADILAFLRDQAERLERNPIKHYPNEQTIKQLKFCEMELTRTDASSALECDDINFSYHGGCKYAIVLDEYFVDIFEKTIDLPIVAATPFVDKAVELTKRNLLASVLHSWRDNINGADFRFVDDYRKEVGDYQFLKEMMDMGEDEFANHVFAKASERIAKRIKGDGAMSEDAEKWLYAWVSNLSAESVLDIYKYNDADIKNTRGALATQYEDDNEMPLFRDKRWSWECKHNGGYEVYGIDSFASPRLAYEDMREAVLDQMKRDTEYAYYDMGADVDDKVKCNVTFAHDCIVEECYGGVYTYSIREVTEG